MSLTQKVQNELLERGFSRRNILRISMGAAATIPFFHEFAFAQDDDARTAARARGMRGAMRNLD